MTRKLSACVWILTVTLTGCDDALPSLCNEASEGRVCGDQQICRDGACVPSSCGDGFVAAELGEQCEDGNDVPFDGCEPDLCVFSCSETRSCDDGEPCNGEETCDLAAHTCRPGNSLDEDAPCTTSTISDGACRTPQGGAIHCVPASCGNELVDEGEQCDDGNKTDGDGCDTDCRFSCHKDKDCNPDERCCDDGKFCNGAETCDTELTHHCLLGTPPDCSDGNACTEDICDQELDTCMNPLIDGDQDGHAPTNLGACGDDCDDTRNDVYAGHEELCDGIDNNCINGIDEVAPSWYIDCDDDGFAANTDGARQQCDAPAADTTGCGGAWISRRPAGPDTTDCNDGNAEVRPDQTTYMEAPIAGVAAAIDFDYNCDQSEERQYDSTASSCTYTPPAHVPCDPRDTHCWCNSVFPRLASSCFGSCSGTAGWTTATQDCGDTAEFQSCPNAPALCSFEHPAADCELHCVGGDARCCNPIPLNKFCNVNCVPEAFGCALWCIPNTVGCAWVFVRCTASTSTRTQGCR